MILKLTARRRWALGIASAIAIYIGIADWVLLPLHEGSAGQSAALAGLDGISAVLEFPAFFLVRNLGLHEGHHTTGATWLLVFIATVVIYAVVAELAIRMLFPRRSHGQASPGDGRTDIADSVILASVPSAPAAGTLTQSPLADADLSNRNLSPATPGLACVTIEAPAFAPSHAGLTSRRRFLLNSTRLAACGAAGLAAYAFGVEPHWFAIAHHRVVLHDLPPELDGLTAVQLTDIHHGPTLTLGYVRQVVAAANALRPDLVLLTGDYVYRSPAYIEPVVGELAGLRARIGTVGVMGNHDWWEGPAAVRRAFRAAGIPLIDNHRLFITPDRQLVGRSGEGLCIGGVGDYWEDVARADVALAQVPSAMPRLLLSHNPDVAEDAYFVRTRPRVDLMICGHTHGGQVWIPGLGTPILPSKYGQKYASGFVNGPTCRVFISKGIGTTILPMRFCVRPEIVVFELRCG